MYMSPPGSFVHGILQARIPEWVAISSSKGSFPARDQTRYLLGLLNLQAVLYHEHHLRSPYDFYSSVQSLSCVWLFVTPMDCSMPGFPVHHQLPELTQTMILRFHLNIWNTSHPGRSITVYLFHCLVNPWLFHSNVWQNSIQKKKKRGR